MMYSPTLASALPISSGEGVFALVEFVLSLLPKERLSPAESALLEGLRELTDSFGAYIGEAEDREDVLVRVDAVLEDPAFHDALLRTFKAITAQQGADVLAPLAEAAQRDVAATGLARALGPAALLALRQFDANVTEVARCLRPLFAAISLDVESSGPESVGDDPLGFVTSPDVPVPMAQALLAVLRLNALLMAAVHFSLDRPPAARWWGLAVAELLAENSRRMLAFVVAMTGRDVPASLLPLEERLDLSASRDAARAVRDAYARFNTAAERSGDPVFPTSS